MKQVTGRAWLRIYSLLIFQPPCFSTSWFFVKYNENNWIRDHGEHKSITVNSLQIFQESEVMGRGKAKYSQQRKMVAWGQPLAFQSYPDNSTPRGGAKNPKDWVTRELGATDDFFKVFRNHLLSQYNILIYLKLFKKNYSYHKCKQDGVSGDQGQ